MNIIKQNYTMVTTDEEFALALDRIEEAGRLCYKSKKSETIDTRNVFIEGMIKKGHHSVIEHFNISVQFVTNRAITHELVRHRLASYSQESTRWCNYSGDRFGKELTFILPVWFYKFHDEVTVGELVSQFNANFKKRYWNWLDILEILEGEYFKDLELGAKPEEARGILPNDLKTEIIMTCNVREWRHVFSQRLFNFHAHPQIRSLMCPVFFQISKLLPPLFSDMSLTIETIENLI